MHEFVYKNGEMICERVSLARVARGAGTPCYVYSFRTLTEHLRKLQQALKPLHPLICFSMKSNSNLALCKALVDHGAGLDIVSGGELYRALKTGADPRKIVFAGVGKSDEEIQEALRRKILFFNIESIPELERINEIAARRRIIPNIALRVNPDVESSTHHYIKTGVGTSKFGLDFQTAAGIFKEKRKYASVRITGIHVHIGSQITKARPFVQALRKTVDFIGQLRRQGHWIAWLNIGGGLGIIYQKETPLTPQQFAKAVIPILKGKGLQIILEPGRFISGNAGILLTRVQYLKETPSKQFAIVDA
ncbi:MAG: diaminopimelate decarboxylase, partial [Candidatus Omnitrophica bacterium]|nr:diaminopimelate decarboxylase [Candidatus Omnitrophota bacterium]